MQPSDLESTGHRPSWDWLFDLPRRLNIVIEVIDDRHRPLFPAGSTPAAAVLRGLLTTADASLMAAISEVVRSTAPNPVETNGLQVLCFGLGANGALLVARETVDGKSAECRQDLDSIGSWLAGAVGSSLAKAPQAISVEPYRIGSLQRILGDARARGSVRRVVGAFVEALGVWDDVVICGYAGGPTGGFFQYVSPVETPSPFPAELDNAIGSRPGRMVRLSDAEIDRLGFGSQAGDVLIFRLLVGSEIDLLLVFSGTIDSHEQVRLTLYAEMLRESLDFVLAKNRDQVIAELTAPRPESEPVEEPILQALPASQDSERRSRFRAVDTLFDQLAAEAVDAGQQASVIVVSVNGAVLPSGLMQTWLGRTRAQLRAGDFAGILSDTELAVLLCDASNDHAAVVSARLKELMGADAGTGLTLRPAVGMTTRSPASAFEGSLVGAARAEATVVR